MVPRINYVPGAGDVFLLLGGKIMKQLTGNQVRQMFLDYFAQQGHMIEPGASLVPHNDPTLLWINAGVAALKKYFDGTEKPKCNRIANAQKSIRTNDIENVGKTARHHTFFEMLGNFSIGDYFKTEAIHFAWEFLTDPKWIGFPKEKLYISVYTDDDEAYRVWTQECGVDPSHILRTSDNFWEIGEGPGGPDSEIFYDRGEAYDPQGLGERLFFEELENDRYIEVWNVVFSQYDCNPAISRKEYKELPQKNIDTGMGLERLVSLIQGGETNFDTDLFLPIIHATEKLAKYPYEGEYKMAYRVIADHIRTVTFALSDGANFSNNGRGYVLRRVLRRAVRYGIKLGIDKPFMYQLVQVVADEMKDFYPYLLEKVAYNENLVRIEEETFHKTLANGERLLNEEMQKAENGTLSGKVVFRLYDTYGFPYELTAEIAEENGLKVDHDEFNEEMRLQKERARAARGDVNSMSSQAADLMNFTEKSTFVGYDRLSCTGKVIALFKDGVHVDEIDGEGSVIFDTTCFYAESGGQIGDCGTIQNENTTASVNEVHKAPHGQPLHHVVMEKGTLRVGDSVSLAVDIKKRNQTTANHSCTHLLQSALKQVIGTHIAQAGSYNCPDYLRFDFTHFEKISEEQLMEIEALVNQYITGCYPVTKEELPIEEAKKRNATALFDEKYGDIVRVVTMGEVSCEFCGGCHVDNTNQIGLCKIVSEESIGSGVRRITAKTGYAAYQEFAENQKTLLHIAHALKMNGISNVEQKVVQLSTELASANKRCAQLNEQIFALKANDLVNQLKPCGKGEVLIERFDQMDAKALKDIASNIKAQKENSVVFFACVNGDKLVFVAGAGKGAVANGVRCGDLVKQAAVICGGNGGGKPDLAQAGGKDLQKLDEALSVVENMLTETLSI